MIYILSYFITMLCYEDKKKLTNSYLTNKNIFFLMRLKKGPIGFVFLVIKRTLSLNKGIYGYLFALVILALFQKNMIDKVQIFFLVITYLISIATRVYKPKIETLIFYASITVNLILVNNYLKEINYCSYVFLVTLFNLIRYSVYYYYFTLKNISKIQNKTSIKLIFQKIEKSLYVIGALIITFLFYKFNKTNLLTLGMTVAVMSYLIELDLYLEKTIKLFRNKIFNVYLLSVVKSKYLFILGIPQLKKVKSLLIFIILISFFQCFLDQNFNNLLFNSIIALSLLNLYAYYIDKLIAHDLLNISIIYANKVTNIIIKITLFYPLIFLSMLQEITKRFDGFVYGIIIAQICIFLIYLFILRRRVVNYDAKD